MKKYLTRKKGRTFGKKQSFVTHPVISSEASNIFFLHISKVYLIKHGHIVHFLRFFRGEGFLSSIICLRRQNGLLHIPLKVEKLRERIFSSLKSPRKIFPGIVELQKKNMVQF